MPREDIAHNRPGRRLEAGGRGNSEAMSTS